MLMPCLFIRLVKGLLDICIVGLLVFYIIILFFLVNLFLEGSEKKRDRRTTF